jgi:hypothetical protein
MLAGGLREGIMANGKVTVEVRGGPTIDIEWASGMNAQQALEQAVDGGQVPTFTYGLQYFGSKLGYLVMMINETYDSFVSTADPYYYWEFLLNGQWAPGGIDKTVLNAGDKISFEFAQYIQADASPLTEAKHRSRTAIAPAKGDG